jgi:ABC-type sugar transport system ATPase subunit
VRIVAEDLSRSFVNTRALSDVSVALEPGRVHAFVGENGAGKSTLLKILAGAEQPDSGRMALDGEPYALKSVADATHRGVGLVFQEITINPSLTVAENIFAGMLVRFRRHGLLNRGGLNRAAQELLLG